MREIIVNIFHKAIEYLAIDIFLPFIVRKRIRVSFFLLLSVAAYGCGRTEYSNAETKLFTLSDLTNTPLSPVRTYSVDFIRLPTNLICVDSMIVANDIIGDSVLHFMWRESDSLRVRHYNRKAAGPDPILRSSSFLDLGDKNLGVFEQDKLRIMMFNSDSVRQSRKLAGLVRYAFDSTQSLLYRPVYLNDSVIASLHFKKNLSRLTFINTVNNGSWQSGKYFLDAKNFSDPPIIIASSFQGQILPSNDMIVVLDRETDRIEVFDTSGNNLYYLSGPFNEMPKYRIQNTPYGPIMAKFKSQKVHYVSSAVKNDTLYALLMGEQPVEDSNKKIHPLLRTPIAGSRVLVFDLRQAKLIKDFSLSVPAYCLALQPFTNRLYTISTNHQLNQYDMP